MAKEYIITGLDIGTSSIKAISVLKKKDSPELKVLGQVKEPIFGMRRGVVVDPDEVSNAISKAIAQLESLITGQRIERVYVNIGGSHINVLPSRGTVIVSRADQNISQEDIDRVLQAAKTISLPSNREILDIFPREFIVDGERGIKDPLEMQGIKLEVEALALCVFSPYLKNLTTAVLNAGLEINDIIPSPIASAKACLTPRQKELGVCLIDIGSGTTGLAAFLEGDLIHTAIFPIGSAHITNDLAIGLRTDIDIAERIKKEFGTCILEGKLASGRKKEKIELSSEDTSLTFSHKMVVEIIEARISEIFDLVNKELKKISPRQSFPAGIVLTGGGAKLPKIVELAKKELKLPGRIGFPRGLIGLDKDLTFSTAAGLVLEEMDWLEQKFWDLERNIGAKLKRIFKIFLP